MHKEIIDEIMNDLHQLQRIELSKESMNYLHKMSQIVKAILNKKTIDIKKVLSNVTKK